MAIRRGNKKKVQNVLLGLCLTLLQGVHASAGGGLNDTVDPRAQAGICCAAGLLNPH